MQETTNVQLITIFLSSHLLEDIKIDIYQTDDALLQRIYIHNYDSKTIKIYNNVQNFYFIAYSSVYLIQQQFQCDLKQLLKQNQTPTIQKRFQSFKLTITVEFTEEFRTSMDLNNSQKTDELFMLLALSNLKKLQRKILKKMELEQLKKPIKSNCKISCRNIVEEDIKTNRCFAGTDKKKITSQKKLDRRNSKKIQTAGQVQISHIQVQDTKNIKDNYLDETKEKIKHKTFAYYIDQMYKKETIQQIQIKQNKQGQKSIYDLILYVFNKSLKKANKITKDNRNRTILKFDDNLLLLRTQKDLQMQNQILNIINKSKDYRKPTPTESRAKPTISKVSTYLLIKQVHQLIYFIYMRLNQFILRQKVKYFQNSCIIIKIRFRLVQKIFVKFCQAAYILRQICGAEVSRAYQLWKEFFTQFSKLRFIYQFFHLQPRTDIDISTPPLISYDLHLLAVDVLRSTRDYY